MIDVVEFLHDLRQQMINEWHDETTIVRFEVDKDVATKNVHLIIVCQKVYQPIRVDPEDQLNQKLIDFCLTTFRASHVQLAPSIAEMESQMTEHGTCEHVGNENE